MRHMNQPLTYKQHHQGIAGSPGVQKHGVVEALGLKTAERGGDS